LSGTLQAAAAKLAKVDRAPSTTDTAELVADKEYHSRAVLKELDGGVWKTRIAEPQRPAVIHPLRLAAFGSVGRCAPTS
jgi:transposase